MPNTDIDTKRRQSFKLTDKVFGWLNAGHLRLMQSQNVLINTTSTTSATPALPWTQHHEFT